MPRNPTPTRPTHQAEILRWLEGRPQGACLDEIREHFARLAHAVSCSLSRLTELGLLGWVKEPNPACGHGGRPDRRRYFAREHCPPGAHLRPEMTPLKRSMNGIPGAVAPAKPRKPEAPKRPTGEPIVPAGVKVTRWVPPPDPRHVEHEPFFSAGKRVEADTAIQRAYGGRP